MKWSSFGDSVSVVSDKGTYSCDKLIITAGPWVNQHIPNLSHKLTVTRQLVSWIKPSNTGSFQHPGFPCWTLEDEHKPGIYYGFPMLTTDPFGGSAGLKLGHHTPGSSADPDSPDRTPTREEQDDLIHMLDRFMPGTFKGFYSSKVCLYTNTPDENFIIDFMPDHNNVVIATGFSGHGFKFASVVGEILSDLAINGHTELPINFLGINRFL